MLVNRIHFRGGKTRLFSVLAAVLTLGICGGISPHAQSKPERDLHLEATPHWAKGIVWYQVFPERFRNGNPDNDPKGWDLVVVPWDQQFGDPTAEEIESLWNRRVAAPHRYRTNPERNGGIAMDSIFSRRYGGDLIGLHEKLDDLVAMGVTGIYLCPVFDSRSLHKYDAWDHRHIDPTLGHPGHYEDPGPMGAMIHDDEDPSDETTWQWTTADRWFVDVFLPKAKSLGLRVVLDGVWNHAGLGHFAFRDVQEFGRSSRFADWFEVVFDDDGELASWRGWDGTNGNLPVFQQENGDLVEGPKAHVMAVTRRWMDPNGDGDPSDGIDGWRLDVANEVGRVFWKDWREEVRRVNPEALIIGEIWHDAQEYFDGTAFDGQMNYPAAYAITDWLSTGGPIRFDARVVAERLTEVFDHGWDHDLVQFNLMTSHDTERLASMMKNDFERGFDQDAKPWNIGSRYDSGLPNQDDLRRSLMAFATLAALPGSVMIYNGDEYAMTGADDPDNRRPIPWDRLSSEQHEFREAVAWLMRLRADPEIGETLRLGVAAFRADSSGRRLVITRSYNGQSIEITIGGVSDGPSEREVPEFLRDWFIIRALDG